MGLLDEITEKNNEPHYQKCGVSKVRTSLADSPSDLADFERALKDRDIKGTKIAAALTARGHKISGYTIQRHRQGDVCSCRD